MPNAVQNQTMPPISRSRGEAGSAYMAVLLVLVILTIFGLALSLITQTEMQVGSNERTLARTFYAADAGIEMATAKALVTSDHAAQNFFYTDTGKLLKSAGALDLGSNVEVTAFLPVQDVPCNLCEINNTDGSSTYANRSYSKVNHVVTATASRFATIDAGSTSTPIAQRTISAMVEVQPFKSPPEALKILEDADALQEIRF
jgi:Tfp pilus assembly protein PilX